MHTVYSVLNLMRIYISMYILQLFCMVELHHSNPMTRCRRWKEQEFTVKPDAAWMIDGWW